MAEMTWAIVYAFFTGSTTPISIDGAEPWIIQTLLSWALSSFVLTMTKFQCHEIIKASL